MRVFQGPVWAILSLFLVTTLAGCHGLDTGTDNGTAADTTMDDDTDDAANVTTDGSNGDAAANETDDSDADSDTTDEPVAPAPPQFSLSVTGAPGEVMANESINFTVDVTGDSGTADTAEVAFGTTSTATTDDDELSTDAFNGTVAGDPATLSVPGSYDIADWKVESAGTVYFRAHIVVDGAHYWSNEFSITVTPRPAVEDIEGTADHTVEMVAGLLGGGGNAVFDPDPITIAVGESIQWINQDSAPHTTTGDGDDPLWDSGNMDAGDTSLVYRFNEAGTYAYVCTYHESTGMVSEVIVE